MLKTSQTGDLCASTTAKSRPTRRDRAGAGLSPDRQTRYELTAYSRQGRKARVRRKSMAAKTNFRGSFTALVTPFKNGSLDEAAFRALVNWQIAEGTNGLVPVGTTGESPTVSHDEHKRVVEWCIDEAKGRGARDRRRRLQFDQGSDRTRRARREGGRRCGAGGDAVLQQADPGRHVPALQGDQRRDRHSDSSSTTSRRAR